MLTHIIFFCFSSLCKIRITCGPQLPWHGDQPATTQCPACTALSPALSAPCPASAAWWPALATVLLCPLQFRQCCGGWSRNTRQGQLGAFCTYTTLGLLIILILYIFKLKLSGFGNDKIISWTTIHPASRRKVSTHADGGPCSPTVNAWTFTRPPIPSEVISEVSESKFSCHIRWFYALSFCLKKI